MGVVPEMAQKNMAEEVGSKDEQVCRGVTRTSIVFTMDVMMLRRPELVDVQTTMMFD